MTLHENLRTVKRLFLIFHKVTVKSRQELDMLHSIHVQWILRGILFSDFETIRVGSQRPPSEMPMQQADRYI